MDRLMVKRRIMKTIRRLKNYSLILLKNMVRTDYI